MTEALVAELRAAERWLPIVGFEGRYEVSDLGKVRSLPRMVLKASRAGNQYQYPIRGGILSPKIDRRGYKYVGLRSDGRHLHIYIHQAVARAFLGPVPGGKEVAHGDGDQTNNRLSNLRYATRSENHADKVLHGTMPRGTSHALSRLSAADVSVIVGSADAQVNLAKRFGVSQQHISKIKRGHRWSGGAA